MSSGNEMDCIAATKERAKLEADLEQLGADKEAERARIEELRAEAAALIPLVHSKLPTLDYPGLTQIEVLEPPRRVSRLLGGSPRTIKRGGVPLWSYPSSSSHYESEFEECIYMLSDGRIAHRRQVFTLEEFMKWEIIGPPLRKPDLALLAGLVTGLKNLASM
jgi:hypothetical protein